LVKLGPRRDHEVYKPNFTDGSAERLPADPELENEAVSWYQAAAWAYNHGRLAWLPQ
jgi:hypothetical protein